MHEPSSAPSLSTLVVIPVYDHEQAIGAVVQGVRASGLPCLLVDDGSHLACAQVLQALAQAHPDQVALLRLDVNQGKGGAMLAGFAEAARRGYSHVLQIDADGQHDPGDIPRFQALATQHPHAVICGIPAYDESVPKARLYGRYATHIWVWINTLSLRIRSDREILVRLFWRDVPVISVPTRVTYPSDGVSHFDVWRDNVRISRMHTRLFFGMLRRAPRLLWRRVAGTAAA